MTFVHYLSKYLCQLKSYGGCTTLLWLSGLELTYDLQFALPCCPDLCQMEAKTFCDFSGEGTGRFFFVCMMARDVYMKGDIEMVLTNQEIMLNYSLVLCLNQPSQCWHLHLPHISDTSTFVYLLALSI